MNHNLPKNHKARTKSRWKTLGLIWTSDEEFEEIYQRYFSSTYCELCGNAYKSNKDRQMDHEHCIDKWGWFRNVVCTKCNQRRSDRKMNAKNTSGYKGICKDFNKRCKQGFCWKFQVVLHGKQTAIKSSVDFIYLKKFADKWKRDNKYYT